MGLQTTKQRDQHLSRKIQNVPLRQPWPSQVVVWRRSGACCWPSWLLITYHSSSGVDVHSLHLYKCNHQPQGCLLLISMHTKVSIRRFELFRLECFNGCSGTYFPRIDCQELSQLDFWYNNNQYDKAYIFTRPNATVNGIKGQKIYDTCKGYINLNENYSKSRSDPNRQIRVHTCFSYCSNGKDYSFRGDDRP